MEKIRRSILYVPGSNLRALQKARQLSCDVVALDLEDSVAPEAKPTARQAVFGALRDFGAREVVVRINPLSTPWGADDLAAVTRARPDGIVLPKVDDASQLASIGGDIPLWVMIETPRAVLNLAAIAAGGAAVLMLGSNDLLSAMGARAMPDRRNLWGAMTEIVIAARAHGLEAIDGAFNAIDDGAGLAAECAQGRAFGFDGKTLIHPSQIETANRAFSPDENELADARRIVAAFKRPENHDKGAIALDGRMVERLHAKGAARLIARAETIAARRPSC